MSLERWLRDGWLQRDETTVAEIQRLLQVADRQLGDAHATGLSTDGRFKHACDAALQLCMIALRASGYRVPKGAEQHNRAIDSLRHTLGEQWAEMCDHIERCSRVRGQTNDRIDVVNETDAQELIDTARQLRADVINWLTAHHADLLPPDL